MSFLEEIFGPLFGAIFKKGIIAAIAAIFVVIATIRIMWDRHEQDKMIKLDEYQEKKRKEQISEIREFVMSAPNKNNLERFISDFPEDKFSPTARAMLDSIYRKEREDDLWKEIQKRPEEGLLTEFIDTYDESERIPQAQSMLQELRLKDLLATTTPERLQFFFEAYPEYQQKGQLCQRLDSLLWIRAHVHNTAYYYSRYLYASENLCDARNRQLALERLESIKDQRPDIRRLANRVFSGYIDELSLKEPIIIQFGDMIDAQSLKASINQGDTRLMGLTAVLQGNALCMERIEGSQRTRYFEGIFYSRPEGSFLESTYENNLNYWKADLIKR